MKNSPIFQEFVKIAAEKDLLKDKARKEEGLTEKTVKSNRMGSLTIEQIAKLYNTKPEPSEAMKYIHNIMEIAHPDPIVIAPSYDKLNGLVPSEIEGQNIRARITMKQPDGQLTQHKYAHQQLLLSLVRLGNHLDNTDSPLRTLADHCLFQVANPIKKHAALPFLVYPIAAALGAAYAKQHMAFHSDGFEADYQKAVAEIDDLLNSNSNFGVGYSYTPAFLQVVGQLKDQLNTLHDGVSKALPVLDAVQTPHNAQELIQLAQQPEIQNAAQALTDLRTTVHASLPEIQGAINSFGNEQFKQRAIANKGPLTGLLDSAGVLHGGSGFVADDFDDVKHALQTLEADLRVIVDGLNKAGTIQASAQSQLDASNQQEEQMFDGTNTTAPVDEDGVATVGDEAEKQGY